MSLSQGQWAPEDQQGGRHAGAYATLNCIPASDGAKSLVNGLATGFEANVGRKNARGKEAQEKFRFAVGALLGDLLWAARDKAKGGWVYRSMKAEAFTGQKVTYRTFKGLIDAMIAMGALEPHAENTGPSMRRSLAARYRASEWLLGLCKAKGITPENVHEHLVHALPERPLALRSPSKRSGRDKVQGKPIGFERTPQVDALEADVARLNGFLDGFKIEGANHRGYTRIFNNGASHGYAWDQGGRLYSNCIESYQSKPSELRRLMRINGDPVKEIDVRASYLTLLHGRMGKRFDASADPYDLEGLLEMPEGPDTARWVVKKWAVVSLGDGKPRVRWPKEVADEFRAMTGKEIGRLYPVTSVRRAMEAKHPVLKEWDSRKISWANLMYHESNAMLGAMLRLMDDGIPSLSVHDSLIVRERDVQRAEEVLEESYRKECGVGPFLSVK